MAQGRSGRAKKPILDPEGTARKAAELTFHRKAAQQRRQAGVVTLLENLSGMGLEELRRHSTTRQWLVAMAAATGAENKEVAAIANLSGEVSAHRAKKHPVVRRLVELIREHQLQLVLRGEFGAQAQAKAAAPEILSHLSELAGAQKARDGTRQGRAGRDRDAIAAGQVVLDVAGVRVQRHQHQHVHQVLLEQMSDGELEAFSTTGTWPARLETALGTPDAFTALPAPTAFTPTAPALPAPVKGPPSGAEAGLLPGGRGRR
jgi:hypothetical protein